MLLDDDVVAERQAEPGTLPGGLGGEEWIEHLLPHFRRYAGAVVADCDFDAMAEVPRGCGEHRLIPVARLRHRAPDRRIKAVGNEVQKDAGDLLGIEVDLPGRRVQRLLQRYVEPLLLGTCTVIGEIETLLDDGVDVGRPMLARAMARV